MPYHTLIPQLRRALSEIKSKADVLERQWEKNKALKVRLSCTVMIYVSQSIDENNGCQTTVFTNDTMRNRSRDRPTDLLRDQIAPRSRMLKAERLPEPRNNLPVCDCK